MYAIKTLKQDESNTVEEEMLRVRFSRAMFPGGSQYFLFQRQLSAVSYCLLSYGLA